MRRASNAWTTQPPFAAAYSKRLNVLKWSQPTKNVAGYLTLVIVGGGPTGVELAGAIAELARFGMEKDFRNLGRVVI